MEGGGEGYSSLKHEINLLGNQSTRSSYLLAQEYPIWLMCSVVYEGITCTFKCNLHRRAIIPQENGTLSELVLYESLHYVIISHTRHAGMAQDQEPYYQSENPQNGTGKVGMESTDRATRKPIHTEARSLGCLHVCVLVQYSKLL